jgi:hypothetical protein
VQGPPQVGKGSWRRSTPVTWDIVLSGRPRLPKVEPQYCLGPNWFNALGFSGLVPSDGYDAAVDCALVRVSMSNGRDGQTVECAYRGRNCLAVGNWRMLVLPNTYRTTSGSGLARRGDSQPGWTWVLSHGFPDLRRLILESVGKVGDVCML